MIRFQKNATGTVCIQTVSLILRPDSIQNLIDSRYSMFDINLTSKIITTKDLVYIYSTSMVEKPKTNLGLEHWIFMKISFILIRQPSSNVRCFRLRMVLKSKISKTTHILQCVTYIIGLGTTCRSCTSYQTLTYNFLRYQMEIAWNCIMHRPWPTAFSHNHIYFFCT